MRVLAVDDNPDFLRVAALAMEGAGYDFKLACDGSEALRILSDESIERFDAILLDIEMPNTDGWELLMRVRESGDEIPILFITGRDTIEERVRGLRLGADDFICKPVEFSEVLARVEAVVRRRQSLPTVEFGDLCLDLARRKVGRGGVNIELSPREYDFLYALVKAKGEAVSREDLLREVWDMDFDPGTNVIDVHVGRVRKKLDRHGPSSIETVRGAGYRLILNPFQSN
ncbi:MAG: DNA-binding response OmpR family regulator [Planctomycetota bacterium]|jgi:DNA-binding response OmpR family regulator